MAMATGSVATGRISESTRWVNLIFCIICMIMIANLQYGWTLFVNPMNKAHGWSIASIQVAFAIFIALETWLTPIEGWIADADRTEDRDRVWRDHGRHRLGDQRLRWLAGDALSGRGDRRHRWRRGLCDERRAGGEMVPRPARTCGRPDRGGLRRGRCPHRHSDPLRHRHVRLRIGVPLVRHYPRRRRLCSGMVHPRARGGRDRQWQQR